MEQDDIENMCAHIFPVIFVCITEKKYTRGERMHACLHHVYIHACMGNQQRTSESLTALGFVAISLDIVIDGDVLLMIMMKSHIYEYGSHMNAQQATFLARTL